MEFEHAIFFDNDPVNIKAVSYNCPGIQCVKVAQTADSVPPIGFDSPAFQAYLDKLGRNSYVTFLRHLMKDKASDMYDSASGISKADIDIYSQWEAETASAGSRRAVIIDWDRTLTQVEGFILSSDPETVFGSNGIVRHWVSKDKLTKPYPPPVTSYDTLIYLFGGKERFAMIRTWLQDIITKGIHIIILTNNTGCRFEVFRQLLTEFLPASTQLICSGLDFGGDKGQALLSESRLARLFRKGNVLDAEKNGWLNNTMMNALKAMGPTSVGGRYTRRRRHKKRKASRRRL
jgi:hypothetical protein